MFISPYNYMCYNEMICYSRKFRDDHAYHFDYSYEAVEGGLMLFPAHLEHKVLENKSDEDRISVSFNLNLINRDPEVD